MASEPLHSGGATPEKWAEPAGEVYVDMDAVRARINAVQAAGHVPTLAPPPVPPLRRVGLWRNLFTCPESNPNSMDLDQRQSQRKWHPKHGPPAVARCLLDEVCPVLRALHALLPLQRVTTPTKTSRNGEQFTRRYGAPVAQLLGDAMCPNGGLEHELAAKVLTEWLLRMAAPQRGMGNAFQWVGFWGEAAEGRALCEEALRDPRRVRGGPA